MGYCCSYQRTNNLPGKVDQNDYLVPDNQPLIISKEETSESHSTRKIIKVKFHPIFNKLAQKGHQHKYN